MSEISRLLEDFKESLPESCTLVAVSKTKPISDINEAYRTGHLDFGENKVQELTHKAEEMPKDIRWHMIGHLQRNKVKYIASFVHLIHGVDSLKLLKEINKQGEKVGRVIDCLLQIHIAEEETKFGFDQNELKEILIGQLNEMNHIRIVGLMGMATNTDIKDQIKKEFRGLKSLFEEIKNSDHNTNVQMNTLSMGMSGDYQLALEEGSNMVRIGSAIFGSRNH